MGEKILVPYNPAWQDEFDRNIRPIVKRAIVRIAAAKALLIEYISAEMPSAKVIKFWHEPGKYFARVRVPHKREQTFVLDCGTKTVTMWKEGVTA